MDTAANAICHREFRSDLAARLHAQLVKLGLQRWPILQQARFARQFRDVIPFEKAQNVWIAHSCLNFSLSCKTVAPSAVAICSTLIAIPAMSLFMPSIANSL